MPYAAVPRAVARPDPDRHLVGALCAGVAGSAAVGAGLWAMAAAIAALWTRFLKHDAADPHWPDRDRIVLCAGDAPPLVDALLSLTGASIDDRPGLTEEASAPPGQGIALAVGLALAERMLAARFGRSLVDHRSWVLAGAAELTTGLSQEATSLAGQLRLEKLTVLCADEPGACSDDTQRRFAACGWAVQRADPADSAALASAFSYALRARKPTLLVLATSADDGMLAPATKSTAVPADIAGAQGMTARRAWLKRIARHKLRTEFERVSAGRLPDGVRDALSGLKAALGNGIALPGDRPVLEALAPLLPELVGGSADRATAPALQARGMVPLAAGQYGGRFVDHGEQVHGMAAAMNGMALHGGLIPYGGARFLDTDTMRPALRLAALLRRRTIHLLTTDAHGGAAAWGATAGGVTTGGVATEQPFEQLAALRTVPGLHVYRPADAVEEAECWELALLRPDGPGLLVLPPRGVGALVPRGESGENRSARGGYVLAEANGPRRATLIATGAEAALALAAQGLLEADGMAVAVVSLPCWELFALADPAYRSEVLGGVPRVGIEAGCGFGWERWLGEDGVFIGVAGNGLQGYLPVSGVTLARHADLTPPAIAAAVQKRLG